MAYSNISNTPQKDIKYLNKLNNELIYKNTLTDY